MNVVRMQQAACFAHVTTCSEQNIIVVVLILITCIINPDKVGRLCDLFEFIYLSVRSFVRRITQKFVDGLQ